MIRGDLHVHTRRSDGSYTPEEALLLARQLGLSYISFTDHDTVDRTTELVILGESLGVTVIPGVEISAWDTSRGRKVHLLGYGFNVPAPNIQRLCDPLLEARHINTLRQCSILRELGYSIEESDLLAVAGGSPVLYKQHIMKVLTDAGQADGIYGSLYRKFFKEGGPASGDIQYLDIFDALDAVQADGGLGVLAHPGQLDSWDLIPDLVDRGLAGVEAYHESHSIEDSVRALAIAEQYGLLLTGGSDDHGDLGSVVHMGEIQCPPELYHWLVG
jgi:predicted metal-dependent phosphoesterase TrpH